MIKNSYITFEQATRAQSPVAFSTMIKPVGSLCNMSCDYCYYLDKAALYQQREPKMSDELLEKYVRQYIEANDVDHVTFIWHGGEPLVVEEDYYRKAMEFQRKYGDGKTIENCIQTNGLLVDDKWCDFFKEFNFLVGVSIDGPQDVHDAYRHRKNGGATFQKVISAIKLMAKHGVEYNTLSVVSAVSEGRGSEIYSFLKSLNTRFMQFLPAVEYSKNGVIAPPETHGASLTNWSVSALEYGRFLNDIFDVWIRSDVGEYFVQMFDVTLAGWYGVPSGLCAFSDTCGEALVVEHNGDVYCCDHFVYPEYLLGNIHTNSLGEIFNSGARLNFGVNKQNNLPDECRRCEFYSLCHGECPKHRFEGGKNALCDGLKLFFRHSEAPMREMCKLLSQEKAPSLIMKQFL